MLQAVALPTIPEHQPPVIYVSNEAVLILAWHGLTSGNIPVGEEGVLFPAFLLSSVFSVSVSSHRSAHNAIWYLFVQDSPDEISALTLFFLV